MTGVARGERRPRPQAAENAARSASRSRAECPDPPPAAATDRPLLRSLTHAFYWLDDGLQAYMQRHAGLSLPRAQSMLMISLGDGVRRQTDLAERLGVSKQAVQQALKELVAKGLVTMRPDPDNGRQRIVEFTVRGEQMRDVARAGLRELEVLLAQRIGASRVSALREGLDADWGPTPDGC